MVTQQLDIEVKCHITSSPGESPGPKDLKAVLWATPHGLGKKNMGFRAGALMLRLFGDVSKKHNIKCQNTGT